MNSQLSVTDNSSMTHCKCRKTVNYQLHITVVWHSVNVEEQSTISYT